MENKISKHNFNEKETEYDSKTNENIPVWKSPKYEETKKKVIEMIDSDKYGLTDNDFWILMNKTSKGDKMAYTGLIISHNGCLKINDKLEDNMKFKPSCIKENQSGYEDSLVYTYSNDEQGIFEVGEISKSNYKQANGRYPYAMAFKRLFDRVVLKNSKLAYSGVYSDSEADEFKEPITEKDKFLNQMDADEEMINEGQKQYIQSNLNETSLKATLTKLKVNNINALTWVQANDISKAIKKKLEETNKEEEEAF